MQILRNLLAPAAVCVLATLGACSDATAPAAAPASAKADSLSYQTMDGPGGTIPDSTCRDGGGTFGSGSRC